MKRNETKKTQSLNGIQIFVVFINVFVATTTTQQVRRCKGNASVVVVERSRAINRCARQQVSLSSVADEVESSSFAPH